MEITSLFCFLLKTDAFLIRHAIAPTTPQASSDATLLYVASALVLNLELVEMALALMKRIFSLLNYLEIHLPLKYGCLYQRNYCCRVGQSDG